MIMDKLTLALMEKARDWKEQRTALRKERAAAFDAETEAKCKVVDIDKQLKELEWKLDAACKLSDDVYELVWGKRREPSHYSSSSVVEPY